MANTPLHRLVVKVAGESGQGVNSVGEILTKSFKETGHYVFGYREYPSLIKGGYSSFQIEISEMPMSASSSQCDVLCCLSRVSVHAYLKSLRPGGQLLHTLKALTFRADEQAFIEQNQIKIEFVDAVKIAEDLGGRWIMANTVVIGVLLELLQLPETVVTRVLKEEFANKPQVLDINLQCVQAGLKYPLTTLSSPQIPAGTKPELDDAYLMTGNHGIALGAVSAGVRAYYAYPMTPSSSILTILANWSHQTGMLVKKIDYEISVAQLTVVSMFMGTRALCGTSGGGFDLMTETVSMAGMTETPFVCVLGQRPGPATGLPTWTSAADLNLAVYGGHGEFGRCVVAASDLESAYRLVGEAFNVAEKYQLPVILLTEKQIAESLYCIEKLPTPAPIERSLVSPANLENLKPVDRYEITESGISKRWVPGQSTATYDANSDEHLPDGSLTELAEPSKAQYDKRLRKEQTLLAELPEPEYYGDPDAQLVFVGWGSVKGVILDTLEILRRNQSSHKVGYVHYEYVYPVRTDLVEELHQHVGERLVLIENNYLGQLGALINQKTDWQFSKKLLKYDGRPFFIEDVLNYIESELK